ncbi:MFS transporter [bacterium]|nr:MFS transporter [bacterium]
MKQYTGYKQLATAAAFASIFACAVIVTVVPAAIMEIKRSFGVSVTQLGWIFRLLMLAFLAAVIVGGHYGDRIGKIPPIALGGVCMAVGMVMFARADSFNIALVAISIAGIGAGLTEGLGTALVADLYMGAKRRAMTNLGQVAFAAGAVIGPAVTARILRAGIDWQAAFWGAAGICVLAGMTALVTLAFHRDLPVNSETEGGDWRAVIKDPLVIWLGIGILLYVSAEAGTANWLAAYLTSDIRAAAPVAAASIAVFWFGIGAGRASATMVSRRISDIKLIGVCLILASVCEAVLLNTHTVASSMTMIFLFGLCMGPVWPTIMSCAGGAYPAQSGGVIGILAAAGSLGSAVASPLVGRVADASSMRCALCICLAALIINTLLFSRLRRRLD